MRRAYKLYLKIHFSKRFAHHEVSFTLPCTQICMLGFVLTNFVASTGEKRRKRKRKRWVDACV